MAIDGGLRKKLAVGNKLVARHRKEDYSATVELGEDGKLCFRLADGRTFKSPSAAGSAVMGGIACNGWRFWSLASETADETTTPRRTDGDAGAQAPQDATAEADAKARPQCGRCGKSFAGAAQRAHHEANADRLCAPV